MSRFWIQLGMVGALILTAIGAYGLLNAWFGDFGLLCVTGWGLVAGPLLWRNLQKRLTSSHPPMDRVLPFE